jgi:hypothetical protein
MKYFVFFPHDSSGYANAPHCYVYTFIVCLVISTLTVGGVRCALEWVLSWFVFCFYLCAIGCVVGKPYRFYNRKYDDFLHARKWHVWTPWRNSTSTPSALDGSGWSSPPLGRFTAGNDPEAGWAPGPVGKGAENLPQPGFVPRTVRHVACRHTDWAIPVNVMFTYDNVSLSGLVTAVAVFRNPNTIPFCLTTDLLLNVLFPWVLVHLPYTFFLDVLFFFFPLVSTPW